ncbi:flagellar filament capping protein FliD [Desulfuromonas thiophila]|uniref:Flagellar hook-associated protein 2 n=1 Tax=Desulfuromonas thiophila TaxID=57664 RepID=A0A1G6X7J3_9BACT|nr:flagellar filament capping protein FliD [Desulfuromonas thiophila]SDD74160.1 flagellar hook-associated protein 2 [Desulfuromonas thiophila]
MSTITFSGLATGLDTESLISSLIEVERAPVTLLESKVEYLEARNETYSNCNTLLGELASAVNAFDSASDFNSWQVLTASSAPFSATVGGYAKAGSYQVEVLSLARQQKDISAEGFVSSTTAELSGSLIIGETTLTYENQSLMDLADLINDADTGVTASIIDDGSDAGLRLVLTADNAATTPDILGSGSISIDSARDGHTLEGSLARLMVDGIEITSDSNTVTGAIYGVSLDLTGLSSDGAQLVQVKSDPNAIVEKIDSFVSTYNEFLTFIDEASAADSSLGTTFRGIERKLQTLLSNRSSTSGSYNSLAALGFTTDSKSGELSYDSTTLSTALSTNLSDLQSLFVGDADSPGLAKQISSYLDDQLDSSTGFSASRIASNDANIERLNTSIERMETRLEKREETLTAQFNALELLVSELNSQSEYITSFFEKYNDD